MGLGQSHTMSEPAPKSGDVVQFDCHVSSGGCSGINFRANPFTGTGGRGMGQVNYWFNLSIYLIFIYNNTHKNKFSKFYL